MIDAAPIFLSRDELRALSTARELEIRVCAKPGRPRSPCDGLHRLPLRYAEPGWVLWVREHFATRRDRDRLKICYPQALIDVPRGQRRYVPIEQVEKKYLTDRYVTRDARHMPHWAARIFLEVVACRPDPDAPGQVLIVRVRRLDPPPDSSHARES
jgi:hypothetical protein